MNENDKYDVNDILKFAYDSNPAELKTALDQLMGDKALDAIANRKVELAQTLFNSASSEEGPEDPEDVEGDDEELEDDSEEEDFEDESDDLDIDISDEELEELLRDLENIDTDETEEE